MDKNKYYIRAAYRIDKIEVVPDLEIIFPLDVKENCLTRIVASQVIYPHITEETYKSRQTIHSKCDAYLEISYSITPSKKMMYTINEILLEDKYPFKDGFEPKSNSLFPISYYADYLKEFVNNKQKDITKLIYKVFELLRWKHNFLNDKEACLRGMGGFQISIDRKNWKPMPCLGDISVSFGNKEEFENNHFKVEEINELMNMDISEPYYHQILREAQSLLRSSLEASSRSSIVFSVLAIEIAIKEVIARLSPQSTWLIDNLNSPPIEKILKEFIPILLKVDTQFDP